MVKLTKEHRALVKDALVRTLSDNFAILSEKQVDGIANHFRDKMCAIIAKLPSYESGRTFTTQDMKDAFAEVLAKRILHIESLDEEPVADEGKTEDEA